VQCVVLDLCSMYSMFYSSIAMRSLLCHMLEFARFLSNVAHACALSDVDLSVCHIAVRCEQR
jgi:hypothetical protein